MANVLDQNTELQPILRSDLRIGRKVRDRQGQSAIVIQDPILKGLMHPGYRVSPKVARIMQFFDGTALEELPTRLYNDAGMKVTDGELKSFVHKLEQIDLLDTADSRRKRDELENKFSQMEVRPSSDVGSRFYPQHKEMLEKAIQDCFFDANGPGPLPSVTNQKTPSGLILPHGTVQASGHCAAWALHQLSHSPLPELYVIIGHNHVYSGPPRAEILIRPFQTPFGIVEVDRKAASMLMDLAGDSIVNGLLSHYRDHSIEMELPFLQWLHANSPTALNRSFDIVPLLITGCRHRPGMQEPESHRAMWCKLGDVLTQFLSVSGRRATLVVSGDFVHWGDLFNFSPFEAKTEDDFYKWDLPLLDAITARSPEQFLRVWQDTNSCVGRPGYIVLRALQRQSWKMANYHVDWNDDVAVSFASYVAYAH